MSRAGGGDVDRRRPRYPPGRGFSTHLGAGDVAHLGAGGVAHLGAATLLVPAGDATHRGPDDAAAARRPGRLRAGPGRAGLRAAVVVHPGHPSGPGGRPRRRAGADGEPGPPRPAGGRADGAAG
ncbi:hypothetical protein [Frankia sp. AvcI1]|uniref:hypothetical protein n=1 Tax=Frankia sp. AvcI1 TaxID=573496 RepID=UPI0012FE7C05|nr:hypothetical protein [Frankia sp. AvcI1]